MTNDQLLALCRPARKMIAAAASDGPPGIDVAFSGLCVRLIDDSDDQTYEGEEGEPGPNAPAWVFEVYGCVSGFQGVPKLTIKCTLAHPATMPYAEVVAALVADYAGREPVALQNRSAAPEPTPDMAHPAGIDSGASGGLQ